MAVRTEWHGDRVLARIRDGEVAGLTLAAEHLLQTSRAIVPLEEGTLERSGTATVDPAKREAAVSYDTVYAVVQHEKLSYRHAPGRTAKYLEGPMNSERGTMLGLIAAATRRRMRGL